MTEKRFKLRLSKLGNGMITDTQKREDLYFDKEFLDATLPKTNEWLNELHEENKQLKQQKARYKRLSEIRNEEINNRILTIKEFIDNCSNEKVKKALEDLFYSEVNEYDLSKKYRKLHDKYKKLQLENNGLKYALKYIKKIDVEIDVGDFND